MFQHESTYSDHTATSKENDMLKKTNAIIGIVMLALLFSGMLPMATADEALDKAFDALKSYDWGQDRNVLKPIEDAIVASHGDDAARKGLATKLAAVLPSDASRAAKDFACRKLSIIGTEDCVPTVAALLPNAELSHMARYALERIPCTCAADALRDALGKTSGKTKVGVINSLGARGDAESVSALVALLEDADAQIAGAAAAALGAIGNADAAKALGAFQKKAPEALRLAAADAYLACAEGLLTAGKKAEAMAIYKSLTGEGQPKHVRLAATRGLLAATGKK